MSAQNSSDHTKMDEQDQKNETNPGYDKPSRHDQQDLNHPSGLHPAKIRKPTSRPIAKKTSSLGMEKQMEVAIGETEETSPNFKRAKGNSRAAAEVVPGSGFENDDLQPPNEAIARGNSIKANQDRPIYSKMKGTEPNKENTSGVTSYSNQVTGKESKNTNVMSITQVEESLQENTPGTDEDSTSNQNQSLPLSNNQPVYGAEEDHQIQPSSELTSHRPERSEIRKRRHEALEGVHGFPSTATASDNDNSLVMLAVKKIESNTIQKLLEDVVEEAQRRKRRNIQETNQQEHALEASATSDVEQAISPATNSPDVDHSLSQEARNDDNRKAQDKCQEARQSCIEMDYTEEQIDQAVNEYHRRHGGSNDYSGVDLASLMETRQDEVQDAPDDQSPPPSNHNPPSDNKKLVTMAAGCGQYQAIATVTYNGHPYDDSIRHTIHVDVPLERCNCGCEPEIIPNFYFP